MASQARVVGPRSSVASRLFEIANYAFLALLGAVTLGPFVYLIIGSVTEANYYRAVGVSLSPAHWNLNSYEVLLGSASRIYQSLKVTAFITVVGTFLSLAVTACLAYGLSKREVPGRNLIVVAILFTMLFSGGLVPFYVVVKSFGLINSLWSLILPVLVNAWYLLIMMKFYEALPAEIEDAARIDGCSELGLFWRIALPLSKPVLATMGLFYAVGYWNEWFWATVFLSDAQLYPLQLVLRGILSQVVPVVDPQASVDQAASAAQAMPPVEVLRMAAIMVTVLPIALVYPFLQRYFAKGVLLGAIKG